MHHPAGDGGTGLRVRHLRVHLDELHEGQQLRDLVLAAIVVQGQRVARLLEAAAGVDDLGVHLDVAADSEDAGRGRQHRGRAAEQQRPGQVHEGRPAVRQHLESHRQDGVGEDVGAGHVAGGRAGGVLLPGAIEQLVAEHLARPVQNGLAGDVYLVLRVVFRWHGTFSGQG